MKGRSIFTIGHSNRPLEEFVAILRAQGIQQVVDVRSIPRSRHNPQFNREVIARSLRNKRIGYRLMKDLGGFRHTVPDSINTGWEKASFRGFADYMQTASFDAALEKLIAISAARTTAIMCAESVPWRCHRSLIADALAARGIRVGHIYSAASVKEHGMTSFCRVRKGRVFYPGNEEGGAQSPR